jgi:uncharacterized membrane protein
MAGFTRSVFIARPVEEVFDFATDLKNASRLMPSVTHAEMLSEGGMKPGAKFRETRLMGRKERSCVIEVVEHQRPALHAARSAMMGIRALYRFRFAPDGAGTQVALEAEVQGNFLWWLFLGMISRTMEKEDGDYLARLKEAVEQAQPTA